MRAVAVVYEVIYLSLNFLDGRPSLAKLSCLRPSQGKKVNTIERIAHRWKYLGDMLNFDDLGSKLTNIEADHRGHSEACCRAVFQHWIQGNGVTPCSWRTLIGLLDDLDEVVLSQDIREALHYWHGIIQFFSECYSGFLYMHLSCTFFVSELMKF